MGLNQTRVFMNPTDPNEAKNAARTSIELEFGDAVRRQIEHEDVLIVNRLSWLIASQSFLFTAYAITLNGPVQTRVASLAAKQDMVMHLVSALALASCATIYLGVVGGIRLMAGLRAELARHHAANACVYRPRIQGTKLTLALGHTAPLALPPMFAMAWIALLLAK